MATLTDRYIRRTLKKQDRGVKLIEKFIVGTHKSTSKLWFQCPKSKDHKWQCRLSDQITKNPKGCPDCSTNQKLTKEKYLTKLDTKKYTMVGEYSTAHIKTEFICLSCENHFYIRPTDLISPLPKGCPYCNTKGYQCGKSGHFYLLEFVDLKILKYGITNYIKRRVHDLSKQGKCTILKTIYFENGMDALLIEQAIKRNFGTRHATKDQLPDGYTETLPESMKDELLEILKAA